MLLSVSVLNSFEFFILLFVLDLPILFTGLCFILCVCVRIYRPMNQLPFYIESTESPGC